MVNGPRSSTANSGPSHLKQWLWIALASLLFLSPSLGRTSELTGDRVFFSKTFPKGVPPYFQVLLDSTGGTTYCEDAEGADPTQFEVSAREVSKVFALFKGLSHVRTDIASSRKVAFTGDKLLRFDRSEGQRYEASFNYTENKEARALVSWFEKVGETVRRRLELERVARFDRLGVNKTLLVFQMAFDKGRIVAPEQFLPILNKIADGKKYVRIARSRAASLIERIERQSSRP